MISVYPGFENPGSGNVGFQVTLKDKNGASMINMISMLKLIV